MQPYKSITFDELYEHDSVRPPFLAALKSLIEVHHKESAWKFFNNYYEGAEGIRYVLDLGTVDWVVPKEGKAEQIRVHQLLLRAKLLRLLGQLRFE